MGNAIIELRDGGLAAVGYADWGDSTGTDVFLVRFDSGGDTLWTQKYGGDREDFGWDIVEARDDGFFIVGYTEAPTAGREDILVIRVDASGMPQWERTLGDSGRDRAWSASPAADGGIVIAAESEYVGRGDRDARLIHIGLDGQTRWDRRIDAPGDQRVYSVASTSDGAFVAVGTTAAEGQSERDAYVVSVDADGELLWTRAFGEEPDDVAHGVMPLAGGDVLVTGYGRTFSGGGSDIYLLRLDRDGGLRWWQHEETAAEDRAMMSAPRADGGYVTVGYSGMSADTDPAVWESDPDGTLETQTVLERPGRDRGVMILETAGGAYVLAGTVGGTRQSGKNLVVLWLRR